MVKTKSVGCLVILLLLFSNPVVARDYIEVWPQDWSDVTPLFKTSIFANRFFVKNDSLGASYLSTDGLYFKELDLVYRTVNRQAIEQEVVLRSKAELHGLFLGIDDRSNRHVVWSEKAENGYSINYTHFSIPYTDHMHHIIYTSNNTVQDIAAFQENNIIHLVWSERDKYFQIKYAQISNNELQFVETVTDTNDISVKPSIILNDRGIPHVFWMETSDSQGVKILHASRLSNNQWSMPTKIGLGTVQDIKQGGVIELARYGPEIFALWASTHRGGNNLYVSLVKFDSSGEISEQEFLAAGSRARFVDGTTEPQLVWQSDGQFGTEIRYAKYIDDHLDDEINLSVGRRGAFRPEAYCIDSNVYVSWLHADPEQGYVLHEINNEYPKKITTWRKVGIDEQAPFAHLLYVFISTFMMAMVYTVLNIVVMLVGGIIYGLVLRYNIYAEQSFFYRLSLLSIILMVVSRFPIPAVSASFFGLIHHGLAYVLALIGTYLLMRGVKNRGAFVNIATIIIWMYLFQYFSLIPEVILR